MHEALRERDGQAGIRGFIAAQRRTQRVKLICFDDAGQKMTK